MTQARGVNRRVVTAGAIALVVIFVLAGWFLTHEPQLTDNAARITNVTNYAWIDDHQLLWFPPGALTLSRLDLRSRNQQVFDNKQSPAAESKVDIRSAAPGGRRALYSVTEAGVPAIPYSGAPSRHNVLLDLGSKAAAQLRSDDSTVWLPDGLRWLALGPARPDYYYDGAAPQGIWLYSADAPDRKMGPMPAPIAVKSLLGVTPDYRLVMTSLPPGIDQPSITVWQRGIYLNATPERQATSKAPSDWFYRAAALAPSGDRIAWLLTSSNTPPLLALLARFAPGLVKGAKPGRTYRIQTSRLDGSGVREIGFQDAGRDNLGTVSEIKWNPDGRRISFVFRGSLFIVPAAPP